eukprot:824216-Alexandrium_andersonii.AAC.1
MPCQVLAIRAALLLRAVRSGLGPPASRLPLPAGYARPGPPGAACAPAATRLALRGPVHPPQRSGIGLP